jgi:hypothetical protein
MDFDHSVAVRRPPEAVFAMLADIQEYIHAPGSPIPEMEKIPPGTTAVGTRWREVVKLLPFLTMTVWTDCSTVVPGRRLELEWHGPGMTGHITYTMEPVEGGTVLRQVERVTPHGVLRPMEGLIDRMLRPRLTERLGAIRDLLERDAAEPH